MELVRQLLRLQQKRNKTEVGSWKYFFVNQKSPFEKTIERAVNERARDMEQRIYGNLRQHVQLTNGSRIESFGDATGNIRGRR